MSLDQDIISFDLRKGQGTRLDVAQMFPLTEVHAIHSSKPTLETVHAGVGKVYDFSVSHTLSIHRFRTLAALDLMTPELWQPTYITQKIRRVAPREQVIDIVPPLDIPYGAIDIRKEHPVPKTCTYPDIFRRKLPIHLHARREWKNTRHILSRKKKSILATCIALIAMIVPSLWYTKILVEDGFARLADMRYMTQPRDIIETIDRAHKDFERANILFAPFRLIPHDTLEIAGVGIDAGLTVTRGLQSLSSSLPQGDDVMTGALITESPDASSLPSYRGKARDISPLLPLGIDAPTDWLAKNGHALKQFEESLYDAQNVLLRAETLIQSKKDDIVHVAKTFEYVADMVHFYRLHDRSILKMLGHDDPQRYIIFNQNRDEIRANGGFPGSVITFTLYKGNILDLRTDDVYYYDWNLYPYRELPPPGLALLTGNYGLRDVNYYPDFLHTLEKANDFVERSGDATLTTGIALHQGIVEDILHQIGPISLSGVTVPFDGDNFSPLMSTLVETRYGQVNTPKDTLFRFIEALAKKVHEKKSYDVVLETIFHALENGEILFASRDDEVEAFLAPFRTPLPWRCDTQSCPVNWAYPILTSVSGNKSDRFIKRLYTAQTRTLSSCIVENTLTFTHTHGFDQTQSKKIKSYLDIIGVSDPKIREKMLFIQGDGPNRTYMRLYVPKGSELINTGSGIDTVREDDFTVFTWMQDTPLEGNGHKTLTYRTPLASCTQTGTLLHWYRQPGLQSLELR